MSEIEPDVAKEFLAEPQAWMGDVNVPKSLENVHYNPDSMFVETRNKPYWIE